MQVTTFVDMYKLRGTGILNFSLTLNRESLIPYLRENILMKLGVCKQKEAMR